MLAALEAAATRRGSTPAQLALAWQMRQLGIAAPIASATSLAQWNELVLAATLELTQAELDELSTAHLSLSGLWTHTITRDTTSA